MSEIKIITGLETSIVQDYFPSEFYKDRDIYGEDSYYDRNLNCLFPDTELQLYMNKFSLLYRYITNEENDKYLYLPERWVDSGNSLIQFLIYKLKHSLSIDAELSIDRSNSSGTQRIFIYTNNLLWLNELGEHFPLSSFIVSCYRTEINSEHYLEPLFLLEVDRIRMNAYSLGDILLYKLDTYPSIYFFWKEVETLDKFYKLTFHIHNSNIASFISYLVEAKKNPLLKDVLDDYDYPNHKVHLLIDKYETIDITVKVFIEEISKYLEGWSIYEI